MADQPDKRLRMRPGGRLGRQPARRRRFSALVELGLFGLILTVCLGALSFTSGVNGRPVRDRAEDRRLAYGLVAVEDDGEGEGESKVEAAEPEVVADPQKDLELVRELHRLVRRESAEVAGQMRSGAFDGSGAETTKVRMLEAWSAWRSTFDERLAREASRRGLDLDVVAPPHPSLLERAFRLLRTLPHEIELTWTRRSPSRVTELRRDLESLIDELETEASFFE